MSDFIDKISSYNIFNYLFPGIVFCLIGDAYFSYNLIHSDITLGLFFYYFIGLVISRVGSLIVEPILKKCGFVQFADYEDFVEASRKDLKLETLSEVNNMYRTILALFLLLILVTIYESIKYYYPVISNYLSGVSIFLLASMFLFSYRKQTKYIYKRILSNKSKLE